MHIKHYKLYEIVLSICDFFVNLVSNITFHTNDIEIFRKLWIKHALYYFIGITQLNIFEFVFHEIKNWFWQLSFIYIT